MDETSVADLVKAVKDQDWKSAASIAEALHERGVVHPLIEISFARRSLSDLNYREALVHANRALELDPKSKKASEIHANAVLQLGYKGIASELAATGDFSPDESLFDKVRCAPDYATAETESLKILASDPSNIIAKCYLLQSRWIGRGDEESGSALETLFREEGQLNAGLLLAHGLRVLRRFDAAVEVLRKCATLAPDNVWVGMSLIQSLDAAGKIEEALEVFTNMPERLQNLAAIKYAYVGILFHSGRLLEAESIVWELFKSAPEDLRFLRGAVWLVRKRRRWYLVPTIFYLYMTSGHHTIDKMKIKIGLRRALRRS